MSDNTKRILITDFVHEHLSDGLTKMGYQIDYQPQIRYEDIFPIISDYIGIIINSKVKMTRELMALGSSLQFVARLGSGLDIIDLPAARELGIHIFSAPEGNRVAVAEHSIGMLLSLANNLRMADMQVRNKIWNREKSRGWEIEGKTIGIIGFGNNGSALAERLAGFNCKILVYDKYKKQFAHLYKNVTEVELPFLIKNSKIISFHVPLTEETHHLLDDDFIEKCDEGAIIINSSRGKVVDTRALLRGLESKKIAGACLDVFENEKPEKYNIEEKEMYKTLFEMENVILSPHVAGWTKESFFKISDSILRQIASISLISNR